MLPVFATSVVTGRNVHRAVVVSQARSLDISRDGIEEQTCLAEANKGRGRAAGEALVPYL